MPRPIVPQSYWDEAIDIVKADLQNAINKHGSYAAVSTHEIFGDISEEALKELLDAIHANDLTEVENELANVAVAAIWGIASIRCKAVGVSWIGNKETLDE